MHGVFHHNDLNYFCYSTSIIGDGNRLKMTFYNNKDANVRVASTNTKGGHPLPARRQVFDVDNRA